MATSFKSAALTIAAVLALCLPWCAPSIARAANSYGSISGDISFEGHSLADLDVYVRAVYNAGANAEGGVESASEVVALDQTGHYTISHLLTSRRWTIKVGASCSRASGDQCTYGEVYGGDASSPEAATYRIVSADADLKWPDITVHQDGFISGTVRLANGQPAPNVWVSIFTAGTGETFSSSVGYGQTDSSGSFRYLVPLGAYSIGFTNAANAFTYSGGGIYRLSDGVQGLHNQWFNNRASYDSAVVVDVRAPLEEIQHIDATLTATAAPPPSADLPYANYLALGDSYSSGEGAHAYYPGTDTDKNHCHRSQKSFSAYMANDAFTRGTYASWACSGATMSDLSDQQVNASAAPWDDPQEVDFTASSLQSHSAAIAAYDRLSPETRLVTISIGGNDLGFSQVLTACVHNAIPSGIPFIGHSCAYYQDTNLQAKLRQLIAADAWGRVVDQIRQRSPQARIAVLGYPHFYPLDYSPDDEAANTCLATGVRYADQEWINGVIAQTDQAISDAARSRGASFVDLFNASKGHELCTQGEQFLNGLDLKPGGGFVNPESYHPTAYGYRVEATQIEDTLSAPESPTSFTLHEGETTTLHRVLKAGAATNFYISWPGSDDSTRLISPTGRKIDASLTDADVYHYKSANTDYFSVKHGEAGTWTVEVTGVQLADSGELVQVSSSTTPIGNERPVPSIAQQIDDLDDWRVAFNAGGSKDGDGQIVKYEWDFGDGAVGTGIQTSHTYTRAGDYYPSLIVTDNGGATAVTEGAVVHISDELAYSSGSGTDRHIAISHLDGSARRLVTSGLGADSSPEFSPDGSRLAYISTAAGTPTLKVLDLRDGSSRSVADGLSLTSGPSWSPDGERIAFARSDGSAIAQIFTAAAAGSDVRRVTHGSSINSRPAWSPDGHQIAFTSTSATGVSKISVVPAAGGDATPLTDGLTVDNDAAWSPDGGWLAFTTNSGASATISTMKADGSQRSALRTGPDPSSNPAYSPDGQRLAFLSGSPTTEQVYVMTLNQPSTATRVTPDMTANGAPSWR